MIRKLKNKSETVGLGIPASIALMTAVFLCGVVAGCVTAATVDTSSGQTLSEYITSYLEGMTPVHEYGSLFLSTLFNYLKYPVLSFLFGFTALGVLCVPAVVCVRGFFLSFSVTTVIRMFGYKGLLVALSMFGFSSFITISCLLIISAFAMCAAISFLRFMLNKKRYVIGSILPVGYFTVFGFCAVIMIISAALDAFITPSLITLATRTVL